MRSSSQCVVVVESDSLCRCWESFQTSSNASDQVFNRLILCGSGAFGLRQQTNSFFPGSGSVQGEDEYAGRWALVGTPGAASVRLEVMSSTDSDVASPLDFGVVQQDGAFTFDDNFGYANTNAATMSDASAACAASGSGAGGSGAGGSGPTPELGECDGIPAPQDACEQCG